MEEFINNWGQSHKNICFNLELDPYDCDDILMLDYFYNESYKVWIPKNSSLYSNEEQRIANELRNRLSE